MLVFTKDTNDRVELWVILNLFYVRVTIAEEKQQEPESGEVATTPDSSEPEPPKPPSTDVPSLVSAPSPPTPPKPTSPLIRSREACSMEKVEGNCKGQRPRFFFNPDTKKCEGFVYTGCRGNLNNFASLEDCRELCETVAPSPPNPPSKGTKTTGLLGRSRQIETSPSSQQEPKSISCKCFIKIFYRLDEIHIIRL